MHVTLSEARMREDGHKARQQLLTTQTVSILQHKELRQVHVGGLRFKVYPHQTSLRILQVNSAASTVLRAFFSTYEKAATPRESPLENNAVAPSVFPTPRWSITPKHMRSHSQVLSSFSGLPLSSGTQGLQCTSHEENKRMFLTRVLRTQAPHNVRPAACRCSDAPQ